MIHSIMSAKQANVHYIYIANIRATRLEISINDFATTTIQIQVALINSSVAS